MTLITRTARVRFAALIVGMALLIGACSDEDDKFLREDTAPADGGAAVSAEEVAELKTVTKGKLTACIDTSNRPFAFEEGDQVDGVEPELLRGLAGRFALETAFVPTAREAALEGVDSGKCDFTGMVMSEEVEKTHLFTEPYFVVYPSLLVRTTDADRYNGVATLKGRVVGVQAGTTAAAYAKANARGATVKEFTGDPENDGLFAALDGGQVDAVIHDLPGAAFRAGTSGGKTAVTKIFTDAEKKIYAFALPKDQGDLQKVLDDGLVQVKSDDTYPTVLRRFLGDFAAQALQDVGGP